MFLNWIEGSFIDNLQLDIVGFLAILGEGSVTANLQVSTLSKLIFVPRLLPAPQVFLRPSRLTQLERTDGNVTGVFSGNDKDYINYIGHVVLDAESMPEYSVRCVQIVKNDHVGKNGMGQVKSKTKGPLSLLIALGAAESIGILVVSLVNRDGMALLAVILLSCLSTLAGLSNYWTLSLPKRRRTRLKLKEKDKHTSKPTTPPKGDLVIRYPNGSFLVVECEENVARELYFAPENVFYLIESPWVYRLMSLCGTMMLMLGIVTLGNSQNVQQIVFAACYMVLNAAYWIVAAMPARSHWDFSAFEIKKQRFEKESPQTYYDHDDETTDFEFDFDDNTTEKEKAKARKIRDEANATFTDLNPTFTHAMWKAIVATKSIAWVKKNDALPETPIWHQWLNDALAKARESQVTAATENSVKSFAVPDWDPLAHFYVLLEKHNMMSREGEQPGVVAQDPDYPQAVSEKAKVEDTALLQAQDVPFIPVSPRRQGTDLED